ncbi:hypothetical protein [Thermoleophilum album]|uniref:Uncharacterized protein n=1 Tax=Thermoleophilum album TaxID=29539 RepID=A0A1H6FR54_THEAL|nr:hypothetical protein [Thermoleophilum album]SEH12333.1 hypothetical protein SAMN02745716_1057 [Thermoleophilum album]
MARKGSGRELSDAVREAVEHALQRTLGSAERTRGRAQEAVDELVGALDELVRGAEERIARSRHTVRGLIEAELPATREDAKRLAASLRRIERRLAAIERRLDELARDANARGGGSVEQPS